MNRQLYDNRRHTSHRQQYTGCGFCRRNRESFEMTMSHKLKDEQGRVECPQLRRYICPGCGATGDDAHTRSYCPNVVRARNQYERRNSDSSGSPPRAVDLSSQVDHDYARSYQHAIISSQTSSQGRQGQVAASASQRGLERASQTSGTNSPQPVESQDGGDSDRDDEEDGREIVIELGGNRAFQNMSRVTNSRYNSAGQLRNRRGRHNLNHQGYNNRRGSYARHSLGSLGHETYNGNINYQANRW